MSNKKNCAWCVKKDKFGNCNVIIKNKLRVKKTMWIEQSLTVEENVKIIGDLTVCGEIKGITAGPPGPTGPSIDVCSLIVSRRAYVCDKYGSDITGRVESFFCPYKTINGALAGITATTDYQGVGNGGILREWEVVVRPAIYNRGSSNPEIIVPLQHKINIVGINNDVSVLRNHRFVADIPGFGKNAINMQLRGIQIQNTRGPIIDIINTDNQVNLQINDCVLISTSRQLSSSENTNAISIKSGELRLRSTKVLSVNESLTTNTSIFKIGATGGTSSLISNISSINSDFRLNYEDNDSNDKKFILYDILCATGVESNINSTSDIIKYSGENVDEPMLGNNTCHVVYGGGYSLSNVLIKNSDYTFYGQTGPNIIDVIIHYTSGNQIIDTKNTLFTSIGITNYYTACNPGITAFC